MSDQSWWRNSSVLLAFLAFASIWLMRLGLVWLASPEYFISTTPDDAYYYFAIARHVSMGLGSTFDGIVQTNGYHPLWFMVCSALALVFRIDSYDLNEAIWFARMMLTVEMLLGLCTLFLTVYTLRRQLARPASTAIFIAGFATPFLVYAMTDGMESGLVLLSLSAFVYTVHHFGVLGPHSSEKDIAFGALLAMAVMARLDLALLCIGVGVAALAVFRNLPTHRIIQKAASWGVPVLFTFALYLFLNSLTFDTITPISGQLKNTFPRIAINPSIIREHALPLLIGVYTIAAAAILYVREKTAETRFLTLSGGTFILLHLLSTVLFTNWAVHVWHFTSYWFFAFVYTAFLFDSIDGLHRRTLALTTLLLLAAAAGQWLFLRGRAEYAFQPRSYAAGSTIARDVIPADALLGMTDCGVFGYARGFGVVNLDGVVNNRAYQETLARTGLESYLDARLIKYIAHHAVDAMKAADGYGVYTYTARSRLYNEPGGSIELLEKNEVYRGPVYNDGLGEKRFMIWERKVGANVGR